MLVNIPNFLLLYHFGFRIDSVVPSFVNFVFGFTMLTYIVTSPDPR